MGLGPPQVDVDGADVRDASRYISEKKGMKTMDWRSGFEGYRAHTKQSCSSDMVDGGAGEGQGEDV